MTKQFERDQIAKAIEKYQSEHPMPIAAFDVSTLKDEETCDIIKKTVNRIMQQMEKDSETYIIYEMAKAYLEGAQLMIGEKENATVPVQIKRQDGKIFPLHPSFAYWDKSRMLLFTEAITCESAHTLGWDWEVTENV